MKSFLDFGIEVSSSAKGEVKTTCPQCSASRTKKKYPCLNVNVDKGLWHCWHCEWSGTLKDGEENRRVIPIRKKVFAKPSFSKLALPESALKWFASRGISREVLERNNVSFGTVYFPQIEDESSAIRFPFYRDGEIINVKSRDGRKNFRMEGGAERLLYKIDDISETTVIVEGEIDALSVEQSGMRACVSVPDGAPAANTKDYSSKFSFLADERLEKVKHWIIAVDNDEPGKKLEEELARRLGIEKCLRVTWPQGCKDANDVLVKMGASVLHDCITQAKPYPVEGIFSILDVAENVDVLYRDGLPKGQSTGWLSVDDYYRVLPGLWTLVTGIPGHGKSEWLDGLCVNLAAVSGWSIAVFSAENQPLEFHVSKLVEKYLGKPFNDGPTERMTEAELAKAKQWVGDHFYFIYPAEPTLDSILDRAKVLVTRYGIRGLVIDPWNEIQHERADGVSETEHISLSLSKVRRFARSHNVHVWIVAHPKQLHKEKDGDYPVPTPYDVSGSAHWRNKADQCITIWRDQQREESREVFVHVQKVRFKWTGQVGCATLMWDRVTGRYFDESSRAAAAYRKNSR
jgi:twinkle protein